MAAVTTSPEVTGVETQQRAGRIAKGYRAVRELPLIPLIILIFLLVIPAMFANQLAPHNQRIGVLDDAKLPPFWVSESFESRTVVQRADKDKLDVEIGLTNARRKVDRGEATILSGGEDGTVDPGDTLRFQANKGGSMEYPLGTDKQGRDILSRIMHGARISLMVSSLAILLGGGLGTILGMLAAYRGGKTDSIIMRIVDIKLAFPSILLALVLVAAIGAGFTTVIVVIAVLLWARYARVVRGEALSIKQQDFIDRARVSGASNVRIMMRHIFPNLVNTVVVLATLEVGHVIILESTLSFLGAGIPAPTPAWGVMVADGRDLITTAWWIFLFPCLAIVLTVLSMNLLGDWLRDKLDPKLRNV
ncbi:MAG: ABC transporter permease [Chloroflexi bacterium]|nr:ABC transporter permease [Chloroflexota bacterium]